MGRINRFSRKNYRSSSSLRTLYNESVVSQPWTEDTERGLSELEEDEIQRIKKEGEKEPTRSNSCSTSDWATLIGGFLALAATGGINNAVGLLQTQWENYQLRDFPPRDIGWIAGTSICLSLFLPVLAGPVYDRYGPFWLMVGGGISFTTGILAISFLDDPTRPHMTYGLLLLCWGVLCGAGNGLMATAVSGAVCQRFNRRRGLAHGISSGGNSVGGVVWPMLLRETLDRWGWQWAIKLMAGMAMVMCVLGCVLVKAPTHGSEPEEVKKDDTEVEGEKEGGGGKKTTERCRALKKCVLEGARCFRKADFVCMTVSLALFQFVVMGVAGTLPSWGRGQGIDKTSLFNLVAVMNALAAVGRITVGALSDCIGRFNTIVAIKTLSVVIMFGLFFNVGGTIWKFYVFAAFWGFTYGAVLMMISVLVREQCKLEEFGRHLSACHVSLSIAGLLCVPLSAQMLASFGPQMDVVFFGALCTLSMILMAITRWAFMNYKWRWLAKV